MATIAEALYVISLKIVHFRGNMFYAQCGSWQDKGTVDLEAWQEVGSKLMLAGKWRLEDVDLVCLSVSLGNLNFY